MRFMLLMYPGSPSEGVKRPDPKSLTALLKYNEELARAGVLLALDGLHPNANAVRIRFAEGRPTLSKGPFSEANEVVGGYWLLQVKSQAEAVEWAKRCPAARTGMIEVRQVLDAGALGAPSPELAGDETREGSAKGAR